MTFATVRWLVILLLSLLAIACGFWGGGDNIADISIVRDGIALRQQYPFATSVGLFLNHAGGAPATIGLALAASVLLWRRGQRPGALGFAAILFGGRLLIEAIKLVAHRPRPALDLHPVTTHSLSFPSAHAANSMIVFGALALVFSGARHRRSALACAIAASLIVGASRPLLGVHWPSDVIAGWAIGAAWLLLWWPSLRQLIAHEPQHDVIGGHGDALVES